MGNYRFALSSIIPNAWLCKLKHMNKKKNKNTTTTTTKRDHKIITSSSSSSSSSSPPHQTSILPRRPSNYLSTRPQTQNNSLPNSLHTPSPLDPPRKSTRRSRRNPETDQSSSNSNHVFHVISNLQLPPVATKSTVKNKVHRRKAHIKSPRLSVCMTKKSLAMARSFAIMKSSSNPQKDFQDSMMEMIVENNIRSPGDLEELLAYYLSLNSYEHHGLIVKVFEKIWFNLSHS